MSNTSRRQISNTISYILLGLLSGYTLFPFMWMLISALKPRNEIRVRNPSFWIDAPTIDNFISTLEKNHFLTYVGNGLIVSLAACALSLLISLFAGYIFSRNYRKRAVKNTNFAMLISQMIPGTLLLVPLYITMHNLQLLDTQWSLILAYTTFVIPLSTFMLSSA